MLHAQRLTHTHKALAQGKKIRLQSYRRASAKARIRRPALLGCLPLVSRAAAPPSPRRAPVGRTTTAALRSATTTRRLRPSQV